MSLSGDQVIPSAGSLVELMAWRAERHPDRFLYRRLADLECVENMSYREADQRARCLAVELQARVAPNERVLLLYPYGLEYTVAFLACLYAGVTAVPAYPPDPGRLRQTLPRIRTLAKDANPRLLLTTHELLSSVELARDETPDPSQVECLATDNLPTDIEQADRWSCPEGLSKRLAFLQYTSGSTGAPKGVMISHENLVTHQRLAHQVFKRPEGSLTVSWLPFYHDMGLIGSLLYPLYSGGTTLLMSPTSFLRRPMAWLHAVSKYRASVSTGPNFAYDLCVQRATKEDLETLDLRSWELSVCGAEPLRVQTLRRFVDTFGQCGFREETFLPCYGLAEATLLASGTKVSDKPRIVYFDRQALRQGEARALPHPSHQHPRSDSVCLVACGHAMRDHELKIVDAKTGEAVPDERTGEINLRGPSVGLGYWNDPKQSGDAFDPDSGFFRTGDTGFIHRGELFVTGRTADLLHYGDEIFQPHELEDTVIELDSPLFAGCCVAYTSQQLNGQRDTNAIVVAVEVRRHRSWAEQQELAIAIQTRIKEIHGVEPRVLLLPPRSIAKTSSGKLRRFAYRKAFAENKLEVLFDSEQDLAIEASSPLQHKTAEGAVDRSSA